MCREFRGTGSSEVDRCGTQFGVDGSQLGGSVAGFFGTSIGQVLGYWMGVDFCPLGLV